MVISPFSCYSHLGPNTFLRTLFSIILAVYSFFNVRNQASHNIFWDSQTYWRWHSVQSSEVTSVKVISLLHFPKHIPTPVAPSFRSHEYGLVSLASDTHWGLAELVISLLERNEQEVGAPQFWILWDKLPWLHYTAMKLAESLQFVTREINMCYEITLVYLKLYLSTTSAFPLITSQLLRYYSK